MYEVRCTIRPKKEEEGKPLKNIIFQVLFYTKHYIVRMYVRMYVHMYVHMYVMDIHLCKTKKN